MRAVFHLGVVKVKELVDVSGLFALACWVAGGGIFFVKINCFIACVLVRLLCNTQTIVLRFHRNLHVFWFNSLKFISASFRTPRNIWRNASMLGVNSETLILLIEESCAYLA